MMSRMRLRDELKQRALDAGFDLVAIAPATPGRDLEFARQWAERGFGGEMRYLANPKRLDPKLVLRSLRSVICVGLIYDTRLPYSIEVGSNQRAGGRKRDPGYTAPGVVASQPSPSGRGWSDLVGPGEGEGPRGWISRYAWSRNYHEIMRGKLERLRASVEELTSGVETRVHVDTGPVVERAFARFSGLGWMGKNTCIINEEKGSWFFLGVILTNLDLEPDLPAPDRCGTCRACLDACPTGALVEPYMMDASRCISYLTIELKGSVPLELRTGVGQNIFGCDICQDVCPWNGKGRIEESEVRSQENEFQPMAVAMKLETGNSKLGGKQPSVLRTQPPADGHRSSIQNPKSEIQNAPDTRNLAPDTFTLFAPPLDALAAMTEEDFRKTFAHSPIKRAKYRGWLRNLCVAMGNSGDAEFVPKLQELSQHSDPIIREHAEWALERLGAS